MRRFVNPSNDLVQFLIVVVFNRLPESVLEKNQVLQLSFKLGLRRVFRPLIEQNNADQQSDGFDVVLGSEHDFISVQVVHTVELAFQVIVWTLEVLKKLSGRVVILTEGSHAVEVS